ncbi:MAG: diguanylate cyclase [Lysobacteraceae bacterium]
MIDCADLVFRMFALVAALLFASTALAQSNPQLRVGLYDASIDTPAGAIMDARSSPTFRELPEAAVALHGGPKTVHWLRLQMNLPPLASQDDRWVLSLNRASVDRLVLHWPADRDQPVSNAVDYFAPAGNRAVLSNGYAFALPRRFQGSVTAYLEVRGQGAMSLYPRIRSEVAMQNADRTAAMLFSSLYTGLVLLWLIGLGMYLALRDRMYLHYLAYVAAQIAFLLAVNGHLYELPVLAAWGEWRMLGIFALGNLLAAATLALARQFAGLAHFTPRLDRLLRMLPIIPLFLAAACLSNLAVLVWPLQAVSLVVDIGAVLVAALTALVALHFRRRLALPMLLVWLLLLVGGSVRALVVFGLAPSNAWTLYGYELAEAASAFLLMIALSDRLLEFRLQRDRARLAEQRVAASLRVEQERRKFIEFLHDSTHVASAGNPQQLVFRQLLDTLRRLVPQRSSAIAIHDGNGADVLIVEPAPQHDDYQQLMTARGGAFKDVARSQLPVQLRVDVAAHGDGELPDVSQFAVLPLLLVAPAWGVLLVERRGWQAFEHDELVLASEFVQKAASAVEAAANEHAMRLSAEFDALTGAYNRRSVDTHLNMRFEQARGRNAPLAVLFVDLDHLKEINDVHGHAAGDHCLRVLAETLSHHCGKDGLFGRYGGDEFVVILPDIGPWQAIVWAENMRADAAARNLEFCTGMLHLSVSVGVANRAAGDADVQQLVERADKALYSAKRMGRDQVRSAGSHGTASEQANDSE